MGGMRFSRLEPTHPWHQASTHAHLSATSPLTLLLSSDQGTGQGLGIPAPRRLADQCSIRESRLRANLGQYHHLVAAQVHHSRKCTLIGLLSTHHIYPVLGPGAR